MGSFGDRGAGARIGTNVALLGPDQYVKPHPKQ